MNEKELTLIIITFNSKEVIGKCLEFIGSGKYDIIVVDNASSDGTADFIKAAFPEVKLINSPKNLGYGRAADLGLKSVNTKYSLLLNPDVITSAETIEDLLGRAKTYPDAAIFAPLTQKEKKGSAPVQKVEWVSGAVMLFDMEKLARIGFFDENIFLFYEETDLCKRARDKGFEIILFNDIYFRHLVGGSSLPNDKITYLKYWHMSWSRFYYNKKHKKTAEFLRTTSGYLLKFTLKYLIYIFSGNKEKKIKYKASLAGGVSYLTGLKAFDENGNPRGSK